MRAALLAALLAGGVLLVPTAPAGHGGCHPTTSDAALTIGTGAAYSASFYVAIDVPAPDDPFLPLPWIYAESNGVAGLQRADDWRDDTCRGSIRGDTLVF